MVSSITCTEPAGTTNVEAGATTSPSGSVTAEADDGGFIDSVGDTFDDFTDSIGDLFGGDDEPAEAQDGAQADEGDAEAQARAGGYEQVE